MTRSGSCPCFLEGKMSESVRAYILEKFRLRFSRRVDPSVIEQAKYDVVKDMVTGDLIYEFETYMAGDTLEDVRIKYPKDWKQAFKERWFPKWYLRRYPVVYQNVHVNVKAFYPKIQLQDDPHFVKVSRLDYISGN